MVQKILNNMCVCEDVTHMCTGAAAAAAQIGREGDKGERAER